MKWFFLSILCIYALTTPGEYLFNTLSWLPITQEGLQFACLQIAKLLIALASLSVLFHSTSSMALISGWFQLLQPIKKLGINVDKFVIRLLLTMQYVNDYMVNDHTSNRKLNVSNLTQTIAYFHQNTVKLVAVDLQLLPFHWLDYAIGGLIIASFLMVSLKIV